MKRLREGVSTGSCMTAGALASVIWQTSGSCPEWAEVETPIGKRLKLHIIEKAYGVCAVIKDGGDDPDVTDGCEIITAVELIRDGRGEISFAAGSGVGTVNEPGLKLSPGEPAINPVPRQMVREHLRPYLHGCSARVTVSVPDGEEIAKKTLNPRLGILGGISILGTTGIVRPMSEDAVKDSLKLELSHMYAKGSRYAVFVTGNTGRQMLEQHFGRLEPVIMVGNHIGYLLEWAAQLGFLGVLIGGQYGKLLKLAGGIMNTHSHIADGKMEILCTHAALMGAPMALIRELYECRTVKQADEILDRNDMAEIWDHLVQKAEEKARLSGYGKLAVGVVFFDGSGEKKAVSSGAADILEEVMVRDA